MTKAPKDIFIIHSESADIERRLFYSLHRVFAEGFLHAWSYDDWSWENYQRDIRKKKYVRTGLRIDPIRFMTRHAKPFIRAGQTRKVDLSALRWILRHSSVGLFVEPTAEIPSQGVELEFAELGKKLRELSRDYTPPAIVQCLFPNSRPMLSFPSALDRTSWRATFRLGLDAEPNDESNIDSFAKVLFIASYFSHLLNMLPRIFGRSIAHRLMTSACSRNTLLGRAAGALQDGVYLELLDDDRQRPPKVDVKKIQLRWLEMETRLRSSRELILHVEESIAPERCRVMNDSLYYPRSQDCRYVYAEIREAFDHLIQSVNNIKDEVIRQSLVKQPLSDYQIENFDEQSLCQIVGCVNKLCGRFDNTWDDEVAKHIKLVFGWCGNDLPPSSVGVVLDFLNSLRLVNTEDIELTQEFLILAYVVLKHFRYADGRNQPYYYSSFFGESLIQFCTIIKQIDSHESSQVLRMADFQTLRREVHHAYSRSVRPFLSST